MRWNKVPQTTTISKQLASLQFLSKMEKAYESLQRFKQTINGSKNESSAERELLRREADDLSSTLKKFCERLITNTNSERTNGISSRFLQADDTVTAEDAVTPKSERILSPTVFLSNDILSTLTDKQALSIDDLSTVQ
uniref:Syntaxin N-terminal domain-containing protein n=1 Tax=Ascaris lumbricoides TaxID=6252 RepID=A0A0M3HFM7_ASCLU